MPTSWVKTIVREIGLEPAVNSYVCSSTQLTGTGYTRIQDLAGSTLTAKTAAAPSGDIITFPAGSHTFSDFATTVDGVTVGYTNPRAGIIGLGSDTVFSMVANTSTKASEVPSQEEGGTNQLYLMHFNSDGVHLECFKVEGTTQGHLYNGIRLHICENAVLRNLELTGAAPGDWHFQPGETFAIGAYGGDNHLYENIIVNGTLGSLEGASAFGANGMGGTDGFRGYVYRDCWGSNMKYSAAFALWQGAGTHWIIGGGSTGNNRTNLNVERMGQEVFRGSSSAECTLNVVNFTFGSILVGGQDIFLGNDRGSTVLNIYDPIGRSASNKIRIYFPSLEQGNPNLQSQADVHVYTGGTWSGGSPGAGTYVGGTDVRSTWLEFFGSGA